MKQQENRAVIAWREAASAGTVFASRQGVYESPVPRLTAELWDKVSQTDSHTYEKTDGFFSQN